VDAVNMSSRDWFAWHQKYETANSWHSARLLVVQQRIRSVLDERGPLRTLSICAGQGRDVLGALRDHSLGAHVPARLLELDARNVELANRAARDAGLPNVSAVVADAGRTDSYLGSVPADLVILCGVFGNLSAADTERTIRMLPQLCAPGATVIWTHGRKPALTARSLKRALRKRRLPRSFAPRIRRWFVRAGFDEAEYQEFARGPRHHGWFCVGTHRLRVHPPALEPGTRLFTFDGPGALWR
jgi:Putative methyltransferase